MMDTLTPARVARYGSSTSSKEEVTTVFPRMLPTVNRVAFNRRAAFFYCILPAPVIEKDLRTPGADRLDAISRLSTRAAIEDAKLLSYCAMSRKIDYCGYLDLDMSLFSPK
jgi:hypothetical protein